MKMNLAFFYRECYAAMQAADWREIESYSDRVVFAKGGKRATLHTLKVSDVQLNAYEIVCASEGIEFARSVARTNEYGCPVVRAIDTEPGWTAHTPEPKDQRSTRHEF